MAGDAQLWLAWPALAAFIALPAAAAWRRRRVSREASAVAVELSLFASSVREAARCLPMDEVLSARIVKLRVADAASLRLAQELERGDSSALADAAQRLALRLKRRVCFERKMLARTAPGLRRGAIAASLPPLLMWASQFAGAEIPVGAQLGLLAAEAGGCALLWRLARVEI
jgi:hypothetical protein